jgi:hypothetical protein
MTWAGLLNTYYRIDPQKWVAAVFVTQVLLFADKPGFARSAASSAGSTTR